MAMRPTSPITSITRAGTRAAVLVGALVGVACEEDKLQTIPEPEIQVDELKQRPAALVDILWAVDNSQSMVEEQDSLAKNFGRFITGLTVCQGSSADDLCNFDTKTCSISGAPCNPPDYHIGVISTDVVNSVDQGKLRRVGLCVPAAGATPSSAKYRYCAGSNTDCAHVPSDAASDPANSVCDMGQSIAFIDPKTKGVANAFARAIRVGVGGSGLEKGIQAAAMALGRDTDRATGQWRAAPTANSGFLRPEASLFVIFVSDEEDSSFGEISYFYRAFETLKGAGNEGTVSLSAIVGDPDIDGEQGTLRGGCPAAPADPTAGPGSRYVGLAMYSRGLSSEFRICDEKRLTCTADSKCLAPVPELPGVCARSTCSVDQDCASFKCGDRGCITCEAGTCTIKRETFASLLAKNGIFASICEPDYGVVLGALGFEAAGLRRKFQLTKLPDCTKRVKCCKGTEDCATEAAVCVKVGGNVYPNERGPGWVYEPGSNAIFFDGTFVPPTDAPIEISYRISKTGVAISCTTALK